MNAKQSKVSQWQNDNEGYFDSLPAEQQELVRDLLLETMQQVEGWRSDSDKIESIECHARSGFSPFAHNRGGLNATDFTDLRSLWGSGTSVSHAKAQAELERQIEFGLKCARESYYANNTEELNKVGIKSAGQVNYHDLNDIDSSLANDFGEYEMENLAGDDNSIMFQARFMYHGADESGLHSAAVSCAVNTEGPYHRSHISWAPGVFCEGAKEVEITWRTLGGLKRQLARALKQTSGEVF